RGRRCSRGWPARRPLRPARRTPAASVHDGYRPRPVRGPANGCGSFSGGTRGRPSAMKDGFPEFVMDTASLMLFAAALFVAAMLPGPGIVALVARVLAHGTTGAVAFGLGFLIGDLVWLACAVTGLAAVAALFSEVFLIVKYVGAAYLTYLAAKMWRAGTQLSPTSGHGDGQSALRLMT